MWIVYTIIAAINFYFIVDEFSVIIIEYECWNKEHDTLGSFFAIGSVWYYLWDWIVLFLYIFKVAQIHKKSDFSSNAMQNEQILNNVKFILFKITMLTILYEINNIVAYLIHVMFVSFGLHNMVVLYLYCIQYIISANIVILMAEYNHPKYMKLIKRMNKFRLFCCCKSFINDALMNETKSKADLNKDKPASTVDSVNTKTAGVYPRKIQPELSIASNQDEKQ